MIHEKILRAYERGEDPIPAFIEAAAPMRQAIDELLRQQPFEPFRIHMTGGLVNDVRRAEGNFTTPTTLHIGEPDPTHPGKFCDRVILALIHVVSLESLGPDKPTIIQNSR